MKITNSMRDSIVEKESIKKFYDLHAKAERELKEEIEKEVKKVVQVVPQNFIDERFIRVCCDVEIKFAGRKYREDFRLDNAYPIQWDKNSFEIEPTAKLDKLFKKTNDLQDQEKKFKTDLRRCLYAFNSHKPLLTAMPELEIYFKDAEVAKSMAVIPYDQINDVRKQLVRP